MKLFIVRNPNILGGTPILKGTRIPVSDIIEYLSKGWNIFDIYAMFPKVKKEIFIGALKEIKKNYET